MNTSSQLNACQNIRKSLEASEIKNIQTEMQINTCKEQEERLRAFLEKTDQYWQQINLLKEQREKVRESRNQLKKCKEGYTDLQTSISDKWNKVAGQCSPVDPFSLVIDRYKKREGSSTSLLLSILESQRLNSLDEKGMDDEKILTDEIQKRHIKLMQTEEATGGYPLFLKQQRRNDFTPDPNLRIIQGLNREICAIACVIMILADRDEKFLEKAERDRIFEDFQVLNLEEGTVHQHLQEGELSSHKYKVLNQVYRSEEYESYKKSLGILYEKRKNCHLKS